MLLYDATHTSHTPARTGIQRVCRSLYAALAAQQPVQAICHDPYLGAWRPLNSGEQRRLEAAGRPGRSRGAKWAWHQKLSGYAQGLLGRPTPPTGTGLVCPELFSTKVAAAWPALFAGISGPRVAVFHDAIGLKLPELTPPGTVRRLPGYLRELLQFDGIAANSADSAASLRDYWQWLGVDHPPPIESIPLGLDEFSPSPQLSTLNSPLRILCVGTIEGRKNHLALLEACESLWAAGLKFELELLGLARADTAAAALARIDVLKAAGRPLIYAGAANDAALQAAYQRCAFTVYPSLIEGFGLPVLESLQHGKPCICSSAGALGESTQGGGCVALASVAAPALATAIRHLLENPAEVAALSARARGRKFKTWNDYARELMAWMATLPRRG